MPDVIVWDTALPPLPQRALDLHEVAEYLNCSHNTVRREIQRKRLRGFKIGTDWRVMPEAVIAYITGNAA